MHIFRSIGAVMITGLILSACAGGSDKRRPTAKPPKKQERVVLSSKETKQCMADLRAADVQFQPLDDRTFGGGCSAIGAVKLLDVGVPVSNLGAMTCPLARVFAQWAYYGALPAARKYLDTEIIKIETMGSYSCRSVKGVASTRLSEHAYANAVDVSAFILKDGRRISITKGWNGGTSNERAFLRAVRASACKRFQTVLSPDYNAAHFDHLHFDMGRGPFCR